MQKYLLIGLLLIEAIIIFLWIRKIKQFNKLDTETEQKNLLLQQTNEQLTTENLKKNELSIALSTKITLLQQDSDRLKDELKDREKEKSTLLAEINLLREQKEEQNSNLNLLKSQAQEFAQDYYDSAVKAEQLKIDIEKSNLEKDLTEFKNMITESKDSIKIEYLQTLQDAVDNFQIEIQSIQDESKNILNELNKNKTLLKASVEDLKRNAENKNKYQIQLSNENIEEIKKIKSILPYIRDSRPLCKAIWEGFYRDPATELLSRIISKPTGIYKITNLNDSKIYIGQAINLTERLKTHLKAGCGIDPTNNEMYKIMQRQGLETFSFEIVEYCDKSLLNEREKYWIDYFSSYDYGYNDTKGGSIKR